MTPKPKTIIFDGQKAAFDILFELKKEIAKKPKKPSLAAILVGDDKPSHIYVNNKEKASHYCDVQFHKYLLDENVSERELLDCIIFLNNDPSIDGIIVQLPLPKKFDVNKVIATIDPKKDVDGFHPETLKKVMKDKTAVHSALIRAVIEILRQTKKNLKGKKLVLISNCPLFSKTFKKCLEKLGLKIETSSTKTKKLEEKTSAADILVTAVGRPKFIKKDMVKDGAIVIDIGTNWVRKKFVGDVDFEKVYKKTSFITPVPGGVGPMTVAMLLKNVYKLSRE